jgi:predicted O-linked N-acetylglucosamine transferase (SPINDLY family)
MRTGDIHGAIIAFRSYLKSDPYNVIALNDLGACLADTGNVQEASGVFELAYSLDDTFIPAVVNHAKLLNDRKKSVESLPFLQQAKISAPDFSHVDAVFAGLCINMGEADKARHFQLRAWLANFDNLRLANCHLFYGIYGEINEAQLAAEHRFWAETIQPISPKSDVLQPIAKKCSNKIRIGYWSPDFRNHSVRYFFRPLLENHNSTQFEIFLYHDFPKSDAQTESLKSACDQFYDVYNLSDLDLHNLVLSHQLDIVVELAGHTSHNRINLMQQRFATVQLTALGYPPTTGLNSVDAKLLDRHVVTKNSSKYYAESPMILPSSFWCFDPMEEVAIASDPPMIQNGYITFGCVGNIAKITARIMQCWKVILTKVPNSRFLIRSINFEDQAATDAMQRRLIDTGIDYSRVDLLKPEAGAEFFRSYNEIDIILDTFPFNGGTTTCFATYMGVPVVSLSGDSLISRMGLSILTNLGVPDLVTKDATEYVECAVRLSSNREFLRLFRGSARERFQQTSLGNGKLFAHEFETACKSLLQEKKTDLLQFQHDIAILPANEIVRRAYAVLRTGQTEAAHRILNHCLNHYPNSGSAHLLAVQLWSSEQKFEKAITYLADRLQEFTATEQISALIVIVRLNLLLARRDRAVQMVERLDAMHLDDRFDKMQLKMYHACLVNYAKFTRDEIPVASCRQVHVLIPSDSESEFDAMCMQISATCKRPDGWVVRYERCDEPSRIVAYEAAMFDERTDVLVIVQKSVAIHNSRFFIEVANALTTCDIVGIAGATRWSRLAWRTDDFSKKTAGFMVESEEKAGYVEVQWLGISSEKVTQGMAVLDGNLLAIDPKRLHKVSFDAEMLGADLLLEEDWTHSAFLVGMRLAVHRNLGILINQKVELDTRYRSAGRMRCAEKLGFDPFAVITEDDMLVSAPVTDPAVGVQVCNFLLTMNE